MATINYSSQLNYTLLHKSDPNLDFPVRTILLPINSKVENVAITDFIMKYFNEISIQFQVIIINLIKELEKTTSTLSPLNINYEIDDPKDIDIEYTIMNQNGEEKSVFTFTRESWFNSLFNLTWSPASTFEDECKQTIFLFCLLGIIDHKIVPEILRDIYENDDIKKIISKIQNNDFWHKFKDTDKYDWLGIFILDSLFGLFNHDEYVFVWLDESVLEQKHNQSNNQE